MKADNTCCESVWNSQPFRVILDDNLLETGNSTRLHITDVDCPLNWKSFAKTAHMQTTLYKMSSPFFNSEHPHKLTPGQPRLLLC